MIATPKWLARTAGKAVTTATDVADYFSGLVTVRDRSKSQYSRNMQAINLLPLARGYVMNCAHTVALAAAQQPLRLYATGTVTIERRGKHRVKRYEPGTKPLPVLTRKAFESGRMGRDKAATWNGIGGNVAEVTDHPVLDLITRPNDFQNGESIDYQAFLFAQLVGEMFTYAPGGQNPDALWPMLPQYTEPMPDVDEVVGAYAYGRERSGVKTYSADEVMHFKYQDHSDDPYHGMGPLGWCYQAAKIIAENEDFDIEMIDSGNLPLAFITLDANHYSTPQAVNDFRKYMDRVTRGAKGKTRSLVGVGLGIVNGMPTAKDLQTLEKLREHKATVRQAFGVSESLLELNSANLASATVGDDQFWGMTVRPLLNKRADHLTETLLPMFGLEPGKYYLAYDDPTLSDTRDEAETAAIEIGMGTLSINEYRESRNLPGIGEDGDVYRINGVPVDQSGQMPAAPQPFLLAAAEADRTKSAVPVVGKVIARKEADEHNRSDDHAAERVPMDGAAADDDLGALQGDSGVREQPGPDEVKLADRHARSDPYELRDCSCGGLRTKDDDDDDDDISAVTVPAKLISAEQAAAQTAVLRSGVGSLQSIVRDFMLDAQADAAAQIRRGVPIDLQSLEDGLATALEPAFAEMYRAGFDLGGLEVGDGTDLDPLNVPNAEAVLEAQTSLVRDMSRNISDSTALGIESRVRQGLEQGQSIDDIAKAISDDTGMADYRAERIARTEVSNAANRGKLERYDAAGIKTKFWVTAPGASAVHKAIESMHPEGVPIREPFLKAGQTVTAGGESETYKRDIYAPPARPNCRCVLQTRKADRDAATEGNQ